MVLHTPFSQINNLVQEIVRCVNIVEEMSANYCSLMTHCMKAISTYDANKTGPDAHIEAYLATPELTTVSN